MLILTFSLSLVFLENESVLRNRSDNFEELINALRVSYSGQELDERVDHKVLVWNVHLTIRAEDVSKVVDAPLHCEFLQF